MVIAALLVAIAASAGGVPEPASAADPRLYAAPSANAAPSDFACTAETLASGAQCAFESDAAPAADPARQADANVEAALRLGDALCPGAARHAHDRAADPDAVRACKRLFAERAGACAGDGGVPLLDGRGRFAAGARTCYAALSEALTRARTLALTSVPCCRCLAASRCTASGDRCNEDALSRLLSGAAAACAQERCAEACASRIPVAPRPAAPPAAAPPGAAAGAPCSDPLRLENPCPVIRSY